MRLIDADALREAMYHEAFEVDSDMQKWESGCWIRYKMFENCTEAAPTIDAEPIKHGHWINTGSGQECSVCGEIQYGYDSFRNYCAYCGAKMDEVSEE